MILVSVSKELYAQTVPNIYIILEDKKGVQVKRACNSNENIEIVEDREE